MHIAENIKCFSQNDKLYNSINIVVNGAPSNDLAFENLENQIQEVLNLDKKICIEIFLDLHTEEFCFYNELEFSTRRRSVEVLLEKMAFIPEDKISHIILYRGSIDFSSYIKRNAQACQEYELWKRDLENNVKDEEHLLHLFSANLLSRFFHSLSSILPDHIKGSLLFTLPYYLETAKIAELISEETFSHLEIGIKNPNFFLEGICWGSGSGLYHLSYNGQQPTFNEQDVKTAIVLPFLGNCNYKKFEEICTLLQKKSIPFKIIEENLINEKWFDIDHILFDHKALSFDGKRMIDGFIAAGGKAYTFESSGSWERENVADQDGFLNLNQFKEKISAYH